MAQRKVGQRSLADSLVARAPEGMLSEVDAVVDWDAIERVMAPVHDAPTGAPSYPNRVMLKCLLLGVWHSLSDPALESAVADRISFRDFVGLSLQDKAPDHATIWRFRDALSKQGLLDTILAEINRQLEAKRYIVKTGTLIDASLVAAQARPPGKAQGAEESKMPSADSDARWGRKGNTSVFGYKMHIGVDQKHTLIRKAVLGPANQNDTERGDELISGDEGAVYADKAYCKHARREALRAKGIRPCIMHRPNKHHRELPPKLKRENKRFAPIRAAVERPFAVFKTHYGLRRMRFFSLARNSAQFLLACCAYNLRRAAAIAA